MRRDLWWALIPGGVLLSLAVTAALGDSGFGVGHDNPVGGVFIFSLGLTFLVVALAPPTHDRSRWWAYIPAALLTVLGALIFTSAKTYLQNFNVIVAIVMLFGGGYLLLKALNNRSAG